MNEHARHTAGPWEWSDGTLKGRDVNRNLRWDVLRVDPDCRPDVEDGLLIEAAPDLLAALRRAYGLTAGTVDALDGDDAADLRMARRHMLDAIRKATGGDA